MADLKAAVTFTCCTQCTWLMRGAWMMPEPLSTSDRTSDRCAGCRRPERACHVVDGVKVRDRKPLGGFSDAGTLRHRLRDRVWPARNPGHADRP